MRQLFIGYCSMDYNQKMEGLAKADKFLNEHGISLYEFINYKCAKNSACFQLSEENHKRYCDLYDDLVTSSSTTKIKGDKLENITEFLFSKAFPNVFEIQRNVRTSSNEIDLLIIWKQSAINIGLNKEYSHLGNIFLCECKNYKTKINVTYIGKFISLMHSMDINFGVMVALNGITGQGWSAGEGLIKKVALAEKRYIIVITQKDLHDIYEKRITLFELFKKKYESLKCDIDYQDLIKNHDAESKFTFENNKDTS